MHLVGWRVSGLSGQSRRYLGRFIPTQQQMVGEIELAIGECPWDGKDRRYHVLETVELLVGLINRGELKI